MATGTRPCDRPDCAAFGEYRAPRDRQHLNEYFWFCLEHVREYNQIWNYYAGMSLEEVEAATRADILGQRPTWPLGMRMAASRAREAAGGAQSSAAPGGQAHGFGPRGSFTWHDPFDLGVGADLGARAERGQARGESGDGNSDPALRHARKVLGISATADAAHVKTRYKELVKKHHPDANGGDRMAEERLKEINQAYSLLRAGFTA